MNCNIASPQKPRCLPLVLFCLLLLSLTLPALPTKADESLARFGVSLKPWRTEKFESTSYGEFQLSDSSRNPTFVMFSQRFHWWATTNLAIGPGYTYVLKAKHDDDTGLEPYKYTHRAEFEVNPRWKRDWGMITLRNRVEYRWIEDEGRNNTRSRHRAEFSFPLKRHGPLTEFFTSTELFYDYRANQLSEHRLVPAGFGWKLSEHATLRTFYMLQSPHHPPDWTHNHVLYTQLLLTF